MRRCSVGGRHCGWGTWVLGRGSGLGCTEEALHLTVLGELCTEFPLKCILKNKQKKRISDRQLLNALKLSFNSAELYLYSVCYN